MTTRTKTFKDTKGKYGIFRDDASAFTTDTVLRNQTYDTQWEANKALTELQKEVAYDIRNKLIVKALIREEGDGI